MPLLTWRPRPLPEPRDRSLASWLTEPGSLTTRCGRNCQVFRVRLLAQGSGRLAADEAAFFALRSGLKAWRREVVLECDGVPVIYARTVLPHQPRGRLGCWLAGLGSRSLGSLLFIHPGFERASLHFLRLGPGHALFRRAAGFVPGEGCSPTTLWSRRCGHRFGGQTLLVTEVFLPAIRDLRRP